MLDVETLEALSVTYSTIEQSQKNMQVYEQRTQDKSNTNKDLEGYTADSVKCNNNIDYFLVWPDKQADI